MPGGECSCPDSLPNCLRGLRRRLHAAPCPDRAEAHDRNNGGRAVFDFDEDAEIATVGTHHGAAVADFDADGRLEVVVSALGEPAQLFRNVSEPSHAWLALQLVGERSGCDALGARVRVEGQTRWVKSAAGYASSALRPVHFGLGDSDQPVAVEIDWPGVRVRRFVRRCS
ncbi:MAG: CRTAC1 family protein [Acidobacteriia bacterium]|nr:CRTAC1 family protein [Terriglobia bacterium]